MRCINYFVFFLFISISFSQESLRMLSLADNFRVDSIELEIIRNTVALYNKNHSKKLYVEVDTISNFQTLMGIAKSVREEEKHHIFAMASITRTPSRLYVYDFSSIYIPSKEVIVALKKTNVTSLKDIIGTKVGYQANSIEEINVNRLAKKYPLIPVPFELYSEKGIALKRGEIQFSVEDNITVWDNPEFKIIHELEQQSGDGIAILYPKGSKLKKRLDKYLNYYLNSKAFNRLITTKYDSEIAKYFRMNLMKINR